LATAPGRGPLGRGERNFENIRSHSGFHRRSQQAGQPLSAPSQPLFGDGDGGAQGAESAARMPTPVPVPVPCPICPRTAGTGPPAVVHTVPDLPESGTLRLHTPGPSPSPISSCRGRGCSPGVPGGFHRRRPPAGRGDRRGCPRPDQCHTATARPTGGS
jgi:hypothetical protein